MYCMFDYNLNKLVSNLNFLSVSVQNRPFFIWIMFPASELLWTKCRIYNEDKFETFVPLLLRQNTFKCWTFTL